MPISRVRSVTDTSMMFTMPMPPTTSEIEAIAATSAVITLSVPDTVSEICFMSISRKSSSWPVARWRLSRSSRLRSAVTALFS